MANYSITAEEAVQGKVDLVIHMANDAIKKLSPGHKVVLVRVNERTIIGKPRLLIRHNADQVFGWKKKALTLANEIEAALGFKKNETFLKSREKDIIRARRIIFYLLFKHQGLPKQTIGRLYGQDHTTVLYGIRKFEAELPIYTDVQIDYEKAKKAIANETQI